MDYTIEMLYNGVQPACAECQMETRYVSWSFKKYCKDHSHVAEREGGKKGGKSEAWNKGKTKETDSRLLLQSRNMSGKGNHFHGKQHSAETIEKISATKRISQEVYESSPWFLIVTSYADYKNKWHYVDVKCRECGQDATRTLQSILRGSRCSKCYPITSSHAEREIANFVEELGFIVNRNSRDVITPKELDVFVPEKKLAIEYHGLYWHKDDDKSSREKFTLCKDLDVRLLQIFSDEWQSRNEICKSIIRNALGITKYRVYARKLQVKRIEVAVANKHLDQWHIDGSVRASHAIGLVDDNEEIISIMTLRRPFHKKYENMLEVARFASKLDTIVVGGLSRITKHAMKLCLELDKTGLLSYVDLRLGIGNGYIKSGFREVGDVKKNYWYTDCRERYPRFMFRAKNGASENSVALQSGKHKIYGAGNLVLIRDYKQT